MANCKTITISDCPDDSTCDACKEIIKSQCIKYTGVDLDNIGSDTGDTLNQILIDIDTTIETLSGNTSLVPQACVKLIFKRTCTNPEWSTFPCPAKGYFEQAFSCSTTILPSACTKTYKIFDWYGEQVGNTFNSIEEVNTYVTDENNLGVTLDMDHGYALVEYITCPSGSTESLPYCFELSKRETSTSPMLASFALEIISSCKCCSNSVPGSNL